jgi:chromosome segregation ATPase
LRKKLLVISKSQHDLVSLCNQDFKDLAIFVNNNDSSSISRSINNTDCISYLDPLYQYQQSTIETQKKDIDSFQQKYNKLLANYNDLKIELEEIKRNSHQKETKLDELSQTIEIEVPESIKTHIRIQSSLNNVNKRLEEEILKLKAQITELQSQNTKLNHQIENYKNRDVFINKLVKNLSVGDNGEQIDLKLN